MTEIKFSLEEASSLTGIKIDELERRFKNETGEAKEASEINKIVSDSIIAKIRNHGEDQHKRGIREKATEIERIIKGYGVSEYSDATDAITKLVADIKQKAKPSKEGGDELTKDVITASPLYKELLDAEILTIKQALETKDGELTKLQGSVSLSEVKRIAHERAMQFFNKNNANFGKDNEHQQARVDNFWKATGYNNLKNIDGTLIVIDSEGNPLLDKMKNQVSFDDHIKTNWLFGYNKPAGGSPSPGGGGGNPSGGLVITSSEQFQSALDGAKDNKERSEIYAAYAKYKESK